MVQIHYTILNWIISRTSYFYWILIEYCNCNNYQLLILLKRIKIFYICCYNIKCGKKFVAFFPLDVTGQFKSFFVFQFNSVFFNNYEHLPHTLFYLQHINISYLIQIYISFIICASREYRQRGKIYFRAFRVTLLTALLQAGFRHLIGVFNFPFIRA